MALDPSVTGAETREQFVKYGIETLTTTVLTAWQGNTAKLRNFNTQEVEERDFDTLVTATVNHPEDHLTRELADAGIEVHSLGDCVSARSASMAFYEARKLALTL